MRITVSHVTNKAKDVSIKQLLYWCDTPSDQYTITSALLIFLAKPKHEKQLQHYFNDTVSVYKKTALNVHQIKPVNNMSVYLTHSFRWNLLKIITTYQPNPNQTLNLQISINWQNSFAEIHWTRKAQKNQLMQQYRNNTRKKNVIIMIHAVLGSRARAETQLLITTTPLNDASFNKAILYIQYIYKQQMCQCPITSVN